MSPGDTVGVSDRLVRAVRKRLAEGKRIRRTLPVWGRLAVDRPLPFLCVYRRPSRTPDRGTFRLVTSEAAYLTCSAERRLQEGLGRLAGEVAKRAKEKFGGCLILEVWAGGPPAASEPGEDGFLRPGFRIFAPAENGQTHLTDRLQQALQAIKLDGKRALVSTVRGRRCWPRGLPPLLSTDEARRLGCLMYGVEVTPIYRDPDTGQPYPRVTNALRRSFSVSLRRFFYEFAQSATAADPDHFHALGRRAVVQAVWKVDGMLADVSEAFDFLLQVTPTNTRQAWSRFQRDRYERAPHLNYRPLPLDPVVLKRRLYQAPVERIEDPVLGQIFRQKLDEVDRQITMMQDRNSGRFLHESMQLYGGVEDDLHGLALDLLGRIPPRSRERSSSDVVRASAFAERAREEIEFLRSQRPEVNARVEVRPDVTGLLVSKGNLLVAKESRIPRSRVEALVQHEVGTHVLTYHNGRAQKLRILSFGLAGYDALQEGIAVLAEYLVGGLSRPRLRLLAGRVVAVRCLVEGASFVETFRVLHEDHGFAGYTAFIVTARVFRGGGLTKDAVYLSGLKQILDYLGRGRKLRPLLVGKLAASHISAINELTWRGVLIPPPLTPRYLQQADALDRLELLRKGARVTDLLEGGKR